MINFGFSVMPSDNDLIVVRRVGAALRALETLYSELDLGSRAANPNREWRIRVGEHVVTDVHADELTRDIKVSCEKAHTENCYISTFPELTSGWVVYQP